MRRISAIAALTAVVIAADVWSNIVLSLGYKSLSDPPPAPATPEVPRTEYSHCGLCRVSPADSTQKMYLGHDREPSVQDTPEWKVVAELRDRSSTEWADSIPEGRTEDIEDPQYAIWWTPETEPGCIPWNRRS
ncbi:hypothetical protein [Sinomonas flava]|uniref:hypothetical protein n=1 Tax=Sinomonas flava TaxID=496857 RepID=UPI0039A57AB4